MSRLIEILSEGTDRKLNNPSVRLLRTKYVVKEFPLEGMLFQISPLSEEALVFPKKRPCNSRKGLVVRPSSEWYPCWQQGQTGLAQQSVDLSQSSPQNLIRHCFFYRFFFFFFSELVQVTHSNMASWAFRCPSPCWALSGPTEHSRQFQAFTCHFLPRPPLRSSYHEALYLYTIFIHELRVGKGREMEDSYFWSSLQSQYRPENITEARENEVAWLLKMRTRSISVCCKLIGKRLQVRDD